MRLRSLVLGLSVAALVPAASPAAPIWMTWTSGSGSATGTLPGGRGANFTGAVQSINPANTGGGFYTAIPTIPGLAVGENAQSVGIVTATPHPGTLAPGALIFEVELTNFPIDSETIFGLRDLQQIWTYRLELLDANRDPLSLSGVQLTNYDLTAAYGGGFVADLDILFASATGLVTISSFHDLGSFYSHSGLGLFSNLPAATRFIRFSSGAGFAQNTEGISFYLGGSSVPEPALAALLALGSLALVAARRR
jgi:hypothetical protein